MALAIAFKEWAVICHALTSGRQSIILRKGGIAEPDGLFRAEHDRFWLYPTYAHQFPDAVVESYRPLLTTIQEPATQQIPLTHFAEVVTARRLTDLDQALSLEGLHGWSLDTIRSRFHYREPGLFVLLVRILRAGQPHQITQTEAYRGCKSWVLLDTPLEVDTPSPVLDDSTFEKLTQEFSRRLGPNPTSA